jgi:hypothetical protein
MNRTVWYFRPGGRIEERGARARKTRNIVIERMPWLPTLQHGQPVLDEIANHAAVPIILGCIPSLNLAGAIERTTEASKVPLGDICCILNDVQLPLRVFTNELRAVTPLLLPKNRGARFPSVLSCPEQVMTVLTL